MSVENEVKFVLHDPSGRLERHLHGNSDYQRIVIDQGYLDENTRLRRFLHEDGTVEFVHSVKYKIGPGRQVEIETPIAPNDFVMLWPRCGTTLRKVRYAAADGEIHWDVDFLKDSAGRTYFVMAEAEMPTTMDRPDYLPDAIAAHLLHDAGRQKGFSSRRMADQSYAASVMKSLLKRSRRVSATPAAIMSAP